MMDILTAVWWYLIVVLVYTFLMASDAEHPLICLWALCRSSLEKCLFRSFAHFLIVFLVWSCVFFVYFGDQTLVWCISGKFVFPYSWFPFHFADVFFTMQKLFINCDTIKVLKENIGRKISDIPPSNTFTDMSPRARDIKERIKEMRLHLLTHFKMQTNTFYIHNFCGFKAIWDNI